MRMILSFLISLSLFLSQSCGQQGSPELTDPDASVSNKKAPVAKRKTHSFTAQMSSLGLPASLKLVPDNAPASAQDFSITLEGCDSTYSVTVTKSSSTIELYEFDRNCIAKLDSFLFNGKTYTPKTNHDFPNWAVGETAIFEDSTANPADELLLTIIQTIPAVVTGGGTIHFQFSDITEGSAQTVFESKFRKSQGLTVDGQASPAFNITDIDLVNIAANGNGEFQFYLDCNQDISLDANSDLFCYSLNLKNIDMTLIEDTYPNSLTEQNMLDIFSSAVNRIVKINMNGDAFSKAANEPLLPHGGFRSAPASATTDVLKMGGDRPITTFRDMILILRSGPYDPSDPNVRFSYTYFRITIDLITQSGD